MQHTYEELYGATVNLIGHLRESGLPDDQVEYCIGIHLGSYMSDLYVPPKTIRKIADQLYADEYLNKPGHIQLGYN